MISIFKKEFNAFFAGSVGYGVVGLFLLFNSLLLWFFNGDWNIFNTGFADLQAFFETTPWLFMFLLPAIAMRSFSEEYATGTIEILKTRPLTSGQVVLGKYLAVLTVMSVALLPTLLYAYTVYQLALPKTPDWGVLIGSYLGLWLLGAVFAAVSLWVSGVTRNVLLAFLVGILGLYIIYYAPEQLAIWYSGFPEKLEKLSLYAHYKSIARGVIDMRDVVYFVSVTLFFLLLAKLKFDRP